MDVYTCSYCERVAQFEGGRLTDGTVDGDFYCAAHRTEAPGATFAMRCDARVPDGADSDDTESCDTPLDETGQCPKPERHL